MNDTLERLFEVILDRKINPVEGSYTSYLFEQGMDKILKKVGEECSEVIISAKNGKNMDTVYEISDLIYHLLVLMGEAGITLEQVDCELAARAEKQGNLKKMKSTDKNS